MKGDSSKLTEGLIEKSKFDGGKPIRGEDKKTSIPTCPKESISTDRGKFTHK
jgi:hypothetical protein